MLIIVCNALYAKVASLKRTRYSIGRQWGFGVVQWMIVRAMQALMNKNSSQCFLNALKAICMLRSSAIQYGIFLVKARWNQCARDRSGHVIIQEWRIRLNDRIWQKQELDKALIWNSMVRLELSVAPRILRVECLTLISLGWGPCRFHKTRCEKSSDSTQLKCSNNIIIVMRCVEIRLMSRQWNCEEQPIKVMWGWKYRFSVFTFYGQFTSLSTCFFFNKLCSNVHKIVFYATFIVETAWMCLSFFGIFDLLSLAIS